MATYACFLRGINVGGKNKIRMADLKSVLDAAGFSNPRTLLQSGNVVFEAAGAASKLASKVSSAIEGEFGFAPEAIIRTPADLRAVLAENPFKAEAKKDPAHLLVMFLSKAPVAKAKSALAALDIAPEAVRLGKRQAYLWFPGGIGASKKLGRVPMERILGVSGTARNVRTVEAMIALADQG